MKPLLGYLCHRASVALHRAAVGLLDKEPNLVSEPPTLGICSGHCSHLLCMCGENADITLPDVAPSLAAAIDSARQRLRRMRTVARRRIGL